MTIAYSGDSITFPDNSVQATAPKVGMVNRIINGAMVIDQRNAGASVTPASGDYTLDRFQAFLSAASKYSVQRDTTAPAGFTNSLKVTSLAATSVASGDYYMIEHKIEGFNVSDLAWGTASAKAITLSFQVYSSLTGTFGGAVLNSASNRSYPFTYSVASANTWTTASVTIQGDTSGTWLTNNSTGLYISFSLGMGSTYSGPASSWAGAQYWSATGATSVVGTSGATFYITGVDLRKGSTGAYSNGQNDFDYRPYGTELGLCQRYAYKNGGTAGDCFASNAGLYFDNNTIIGGVFQFPVTMRSTPSLTVYGTPVVKSNAGTTTGFTVALTAASANGAWVQMNKVGHGVASTYLNCINYPTTSDYLLFVSEL